MTSLEELVNIPEFEGIAREKLNRETYALIADGDRGMFDRITLRPRLMVDTRKLDLTLDLFGQRMFAPILVAPVSRHQRFHPEGELATVRGAAAAKAAMVIVDSPGLALDALVKAADGNVWFQPDAKWDADLSRTRARAAISAGCKAICVGPSWDWSSLDKFRQGLTVPVILKGIMSADEAHTAITRGIQGLAVSGYRDSSSIGLAPSIEVLSGVADAVAGKIPILIDGGFRRGNDILAALAMGARAVMIARPVIWGLSGYGAEGVQRVIEMMQTALARDMAMCGKIDLKALNPAVLKIHAPR